MVSTLLRTAAALCSAVLVLSFVFFAVDESRAASQDSQADIAGQRASRAADPSPTQERAREKAHSGAREAVDDADDVLVAPFAGLVDSADSQWVRRGVPTLLGLLLFGFGLSYAARLISVRS